jgi:rhodanese-related sulfurtransferase
MASLAFIAPRALAEDLSSRPTTLLIVDVRERWEYNDGHVPGSALIPLGRAQERFPLALPDRNAPLVIVGAGADDNRAAVAAKLLPDHRAISILDGGIGAWQSEGLQIETGWGVPGKRLGEQIVHEADDLQIDAVELRKLDPSSTLIIDIRPRWEHCQGHVPGAISIPGAELSRYTGAIDRLVKEAGFNRVVTHCAGRTRGIMAAQFLREQGILVAQALKNGCMGWMLAGYRLEYEHVPPNFAPRRTRRPGRSCARTLRACELAELLKQNTPLYLVDLRTKHSFRRGHIPGSIPLESGQLILEKDLWLAQQHVPIVLIGASDEDSETAAALLIRLGHPNVRVLKGGLDAWHGTLQPVSNMGEMLATTSGATIIQPLDLVTNCLEAQVIDVRSRGEWSLAHVPGSRCVPLGLLLANIDTMVLDATPVVLVSDNNLRASHAASAIRKSGRFPGEIQLVAGGLNAMRAMQITLVEDQPDMSVASKDTGGRLSRAIWERPFETELRPVMEAYLSWEESLVSGSK